MKQPLFIVLILLGMFSLGLTIGHAQEANPKDMDSVFMASPLVGWIENEITQTGPPGTPSQTLSDTSEEYGLFLMYANPRLIINNTLFNTDVNNSKVWGNIATVNAYGDPAEKVTWHLGVSYLWHNIDGDTADITVTEPLAKAGLLFRVPSIHLSINPYLGYGWQQIETTITTPLRSFTETENTETTIYGISAYWRWRMLYANAKYYQEDNQDLNERNNVFRFWACAMFTKQTGLLGRFEYSEQFSVTDTSVLVGPVFVF